MRTETAAVFKKILRPRSRLVVVHSSLAALGGIALNPDVLLKEIEDALSASTTLVMPAFTFSFCRSGIFDVDKTPSETGILSEAFRRKPNVVRTHHPIYSFVASGPLARDLTDCDGATCWGRGSVFEFMEDIDADIVMFGCGWDCCTLFHRAEELAQVPYRYEKLFKGVLREGAREREIATKMWVRRLDLPTANSFDLWVEQMRARKVIRVAVLGKGLVEAASAKELLKIGTQLLKKDLFSILKAPVSYKEAVAAQRVGLLSSSNLDIFAGHLREQAGVWMKEGCRIFAPPFGQYRQQLLDIGSDLNAFQPQWLMFMERIEDILGISFTSDPLSVPAGALKTFVGERVEAYVQSIRLARERTQAKLIVLDFDAPARSPLGLADAGSGSGLRRAVELANELLKKELSGSMDTWIIDYASIHSSFGRSQSVDPRYWHMGHIPYSRDFSIYLAHRLTGTFLAIMGKTARLIAVDLDNTLWGGVVGDDGVEGLLIGGDFPGNAYQSFQRALLALKRRGIALAICSKNTEETALAVFGKRSEMLIKKEDFVTHRINWMDKPFNLSSIASELSLTPASICFIDDDIHEREQVRRQLPETIVPDFPKDPSLYASFLLDLPCFEALNLTTEDFARPKQYHARQKMKQDQARFGSSTDFYRYLGMILFFEDYNDNNQARVLQLLAKTNQFNTTTRRYGESDLALLRSRGALILAVGLKDRYSEREIVGCFVMQYKKNGRHAVIDPLLLSCRVLGRGIETAILSIAAAHAKSQGARWLEGLIIPTEKNHPVRDVFLKHGFNNRGRGCYAFALGSKGIKMPDWFAVKEEPYAG